MSRRRPGDTGSSFDAVTGPLPLFVALATVAVMLAMGAPIGLVVFVSAVVWGLTCIPGLTRADGARTKALQATAEANDRRRRASGGRLGRWEQLQATADDSAARFRRAAARCEPGPLRDRIEDMRPEVDRARDRVEVLVALGIDLEEAIADRPSARPRPGKGGGKRRRDPDPSHDDGGGRGGRAALERQRDEVERRAQAIDTSLSAAVAVAFELALDSVHHDTDQRMGDLVAELGDLRGALAELRAEPDPSA